jgi:transcriptional regulator with XRE-family HTH domain
MKQRDTETLSEYVARIMRQKNLKQKGVVLRTGGKIAGGYLSDIINGRVTNLSMDKFKALARGLDVSVVEIFAVACGEREESNPNNSLMLLHLMQQVVVNPALMEILRHAARLSPREQEAMLANIKTLTEPAQKASRRKKPV